MKKLIVANWKMNPTSLKEAEKLFNSVKDGVRGIKNVEIVICPPFVYLPILARLSSEAFGVGGQNCYFEKSGTYTGEVSAVMLRDIGCKYVIVGHSERKKHFGETNDIINKKVRSALKEGLGVVLAVGEENRDSFDSKGRWTHELDPVLLEQIEGALKGVSKARLAGVVIAYEPVWAIGSGDTDSEKAATPDDIFSAKLFIKKVIAKNYGRKEAEKMKVLYGGSTDRKNARKFIEDGQADGLLVGGASLDADEFSAMAKSISSHS